MPNLYNRVLDAAILADGDGATPTGALDLSDYRELHLFIRVSAAGAGDSPTLVVQHSSRGESDAYVGFASPVAVDLTATGDAWFQVPAFMRWVAWSITGTLTEPATVTLDVVAKG